LRDLHCISGVHEPCILLVREGAELPPDLPMDGEVFLPGWRVVKNFDNYSMQRKIRETNWKFLQLRGGKETRLMGRGRRETLRRGIAQILAKMKGRKFNSLEISVLVSKSFLGVKFINISVNLRHFQRNAAA
jgi:hypothetical protein